MYHPLKKIKPQRMDIRLTIPVTLVKEGKVWIAFNGKMNISGYGTKKQAMKMFKFCCLETLKFKKP